MRKRLAFALLLCLASWTLAETVVVEGPVVVSATATATPTPTPTATPSFLIFQNFEGTGYDNSETWTEAGTGTVNEDSTTSPIVGSQSLNIITSAQTGTATVSFTPADTVFGFMRYRWHLHPSGTNPIFNVQTSAGAAIASCSLTQSLHKIRANAVGGANADSTNAVAVDTNIYLYWKYVRGTGTNAMMSVGWSTDGTQPDLSTGSAQVVISSDGTATTQPGKLVIGNLSSTSNDVSFDRIIISTSAIGANP